MISACIINSRLLLRYSKFGGSIQSLQKYSSTKLEDADISEIPLDRIRNFSIIAHVDHGKSTLADRLLEITGAVTRTVGQNQILDSLQVEKERGITVKAQSASLLYTYEDKNTYLLNLIDTPGHVDFSNEVTRSLGACEGVILLVDANHGVQAQTVANYHLALSRGLAVLPVLNKIDLKHADPDRVCLELSSLFDIDPETVLRISAKVGTGVEDVLKAVVERIPSPNAVREGDFRGFLFDSFFDRYRGVLNLISVRNGEIKVGDEVTFVHTKKTYEVRTLAVLRPAETSVKRLKAGQVGLVGCNMRNSKESLIGDTLCLKGQTVEALPGFKPNQPMVYAGIFPADQAQHSQLRSGIEKLILNDSAVTLIPDSSPALGQGWRLGFLGLLHMEVFCQRLQQEYEIDSIVTAPSVTYKIVLGTPKLIQRHGTNTIFISNPALLPDANQIAEYHEPCVLGTIITPTEYVGPVIALCLEHRGVQQSSINIDESRVMMTYLLPLGEIVLDFYDKLKALSSGYASFDYEDKGYFETSLVKLAINLNGKPVEELSRIVHYTKALECSKEMVVRLKELIPRQMVQIAIQACVGSKVLARETIKAFRKDVTAKLYGGDVTRRMKLLKNQTEGKKKMRAVANINIPHDTFIKVLKR